MTVEPSTKCKAVGVPIPEYKLNGKDYLELWKNLELRAETLKSEMLKIITWLTGFMSALLAYSWNALIQVETDHVKVQHDGLLWLLSCAGVFLCLYSVGVIWDYRKHIQRNWERAEWCRYNVGGLQAVWDPPQEALEYLRKECRNAEVSLTKTINDPTLNEYWLKGFRSIWAAVFAIIALYSIAFLGLALLSRL